MENCNEASASVQEEYYLFDVRIMVMPFEHNSETLSIILKNIERYV